MDATSWVKINCRKHCCCPSLCCNFACWLAAEPPCLLLLQDLLELGGQGGLPHLHEPILAAPTTKQISRSRQKETITKYQKREDPRQSEEHHPGLQAMKYPKEVNSFVFLHVWLSLMLWWWVEGQTAGVSSSGPQKQTYIAVPLAGPRAERGKKDATSSPCSTYRRGRQKGMFHIPQKEEFQCPLCPWSEMLFSQIALSNSKSRHIDSILHSACSLHLS